MSFLWKQKVQRQHRTIWDIYAIFSVLKLKQCETTLSSERLSKSTGCLSFYVFCFYMNLFRTSTNEVTDFLRNWNGTKGYHCVWRSAALCHWEASHLTAVKMMIWQVHAVRAHWLLCAWADWLLRLCLNRSRASRYDSEQRGHVAERW